MKKLVFVTLKWFGDHWRGLVSGIIITALAVLTLSLQLNSLVPGQNQYETKTLDSLQSLPVPWDRAVDAPYMLVAYGIGSIVDNSLSGARITSVIFGLIATGCLFFVLKTWFNIRIATIGCLLFITSSWLLHTTHQATPLILLVMAPLIALAPLAWFLRTKKYKGLSFILLAGALGIAVYVPYMPWVIVITLAVLIIQEKKILKDLKRWELFTGAAVYGLLLLPLFASLLHAPGQLKELIGLPAVLPSFATYSSQIGNSLISLFIVSEPLPELHLGTLPLLDIFSSVMFLLGIYYFASRIKHRRSIILFVSLVMLLAITALSPAYQMAQTILLPIVYIFIIAGIVELLNQWFSYFPRNPWARNFGISLIVIAIGFASFYHLQRYFIAWPNAPETKTVYVVVADKQ